ncbi:relaxase/mobilization nuclease domain-containing protein [Klebsiella pneumoniae]|uniref:Relaxase/mobilization nuclease domain-containing protein n=1 Tax=Salmonella enterica TaxID=28901 RepID=A0A743N5K7_SALER|nr:relaxase/mobilization nuclease domain-containing protein [Klebsiella pneumoniae]EHP7597647.1 relaxase/mobilization nuclease domain-containing protein [Salmonella enterica]MBZ2003064.1 relaxase/mobilization nuclease domain-containing protein [Klebsiella pneumoniae]MDD1876268.1 relaxase/mobilization nuclease domain-containing protein [Klebsiella pneumoniae]MEC4505565.1 relaxase/mobilization nuclease domain-containing protein [Klebsiella pneumoniae]UTB37415.1 relaxase/mobilization nuclease dom
MKGMQKIKRGKNFSGVVFYALRPASHHKTPPSVIGGNMDGSNAGELIAEFNATKALRPDVAKPVWHNSLRLPKNEALTDAQWSEIADDYMSRMGFSETHLRCYVLHDDAAGQHIHIIASRIELSSGKLYLGKNENLISTRIIEELEQDYQLTRTKGPKASPVAPSPKPKRKKSRNETMLEERTGEKCAKTIIQEAIDTLITSKISEESFVQQLAAQKIKAIPNRASTGKMNGFSFEYANISFKASQLGKKYSWKNLEPFILIDTIQTMESNATDFFWAVNAEDILLPLPERPKPLLDEYLDTKTITATNSYMNIAMRWIEAIPWLDNIVGIVKSLNNPFFKHKNKPALIFSASPISIDLPSLPSVKNLKKKRFQTKNLA